MKVRKERSKASAVAELHTATVASVQEPSQATSGADEARPHATAPIVEIEAPTTTTQSFQEPAEAQQETA